MIYKYTYSEFEKDCKKLIRRLKYSRIRFNTIVGVAKGGLPLGVTLANKLKVPLIIISAKSYNGYDRENLIFNASFTRPIASPVLIVDDIVDSGQTLKAVTEYVSSLGIECKTASLFYKERSVFKPTWYCKRVGDNVWVKFPWE